MVMTGNGNLNLFGQQNNYPACVAQETFSFFLLFLFGEQASTPRLCIIARAPGFQYFIPDTVKPGIISKYTIKHYLFTVKIQDLIGREEW